MQVQLTQENVVKKNDLRVLELSNLDVQDASGVYVPEKEVQIEAREDVLVCEAKGDEEGKEE